MIGAARCRIPVYRGLDAAGGRELGRGGAGGVPGRALSDDALDGAALRHRAPPGREAAGVPQGAVTGMVPTTLLMADLFSIQVEFVGDRHIDRAGEGH